MFTFSFQLNDGWAWKYNFQQVKIKTVTGFYIKKKNRWFSDDSSNNHSKQNKIEDEEKIPYPTVRLRRSDVQVYNEFSVDSKSNEQTKKVKKK